MEHIRGDQGMLRKVLDNKYFKTTFKIIEAIIVILMVLYLSFVVIQKITGNKSIFGYRVFTVATGSMIPEYNINDVLLVKEIDKEQLQVGDDITYLGNKFDVNGRIVTHRIIDINEETKEITTKGINSQTADPTIDNNQIYGKVMGIIPVITTINHVVKNQYGFFFLIFLPIVTVVFLEIADTITEIKRDKKDVEKNEEQEEII